MNFFFPEPLERNSKVQVPKLSRICMHQEQQSSEAVPDSKSSSEIVCPVQQALKGNSRAELALGPQLFSWGAARLLLTSPQGQEQGATIISSRLDSTTCLKATLTQCCTSPTPPERTGTICSSNSVLTCPDRTSSRIPIFRTDLHPPGRKCQTLD